MSNASFTQSLPAALYKELEVLAQEYTLSQPMILNRLNVQGLVRLIVKAYLQELRGPSKIEALRVQSFGNLDFLVGKCPNCHLRVDTQDFPALVKSGENFVCHICGHTI